MCRYVRFTIIASLVLGLIAILGSHEETQANDSEPREKREGEEPGDCYSTRDNGSNFTGNQSIVVEVALNPHCAVSQDQCQCNAVGSLAGLPCLPNLSQTVSPSSTLTLEIPPSIVTASLLTVICSYVLNQSNLHFTVTAGSISTTGYIAGSVKAKYGTQTSSQSHATHTVTPTVTPTQPCRGFSLSSHSHVIVSVAVALICFSRLLHL